MPTRIGRGLAACALALVAPAVRADLLVLRDGSRQTGTLQACVADQCRLDGRSIAVSQIAWIEFGGARDTSAKGTAFPPAVADPTHDEVHLADGTVATGALEGISLGEVAFAERSFDRADVRWLHFAGAPGMGAPQDLLILRDGSSQSGSLQGCTRDGCTLDGRTRSRAELAWAGLEQGSPTPPAVGDPKVDAIHLRDRSVHSGQLVGVNASQAITDRGSYPRVDVAWIYLAPPPLRRPNQDYEPAPTDDRPGSTPGPTPTPTPSPTPTPTPSPTPTPTPSPSPGRGGHGPPPSPVTPGGLWIGAAEAQSSKVADGISSQIHVTAEVRMREYNGSIKEARTGRVIGKITYLMPENTVIHNQVAQSGSGFSCTGEGVETVSATYGTSDMSHSSTILRKTAEADLAPVLGYDIDRSSPIYVLDVVVRGNPHFTGTCVSPNGSSSTEYNVMGILIGSTPILHRYDPTVHHLDGSKMQGRYSVEGPIPGMRTVATWSVCPEGMQCEPPPPINGPPPKKQPCTPPTSDQALLENLQQRQNAYLCHAQDKYDEVKKLDHDAKQLQSDFELVSRDCKLWMAARTLLGFMVGKFSPRGEIEIVVHEIDANGTVIAEHVETIETEAGKQFYLFLDWLNKVSNGEKSWVLPNTEFKDWVSLEDAYEGFEIAYDSLRASSPETMREEFNQCEAPVPDNVSEGALGFLRLLEEEQEALKEMHQLLNTVRHYDDDLFHQWSKYRDECREYQECMGGDPSSCDVPQQAPVERGPDGKCPPLGPSPFPP